MNISNGRVFWGTVCLAGIVVGKRLEVVFVATGLGEGDVSRFSKSSRNWKDLLSHLKFV
ncbi:MAG: hypothetical protein ACKVU0_00980 [Saprospiraceae bacterium]